MKKSQLVQLIKESLNESHKDTIAQKQFKMNYSQLGKNEKEWVDDEIDNIEYKKNKKKVNENYEEVDDEFDTGGYVEAMGPELDKHVKAIAGIFQEWENGPATEPGMVGYAMYDLIEYIKRAIRR
jgi:isopentenyldiphosphate isomerase